MSAIDTASSPRAKKDIIDHQERLLQHENQLNSRASSRNPNLLRPSSSRDLADVTVVAEVVVDNGHRASASMPVDLKRRLQSKILCGGTTTSGLRIWVRITAPRPAVEDVDPAGRAHSHLGRASQWAARVGTCSPADKRDLGAAHITTSDP